MKAFSAPAPAFFVWVDKKELAAKLILHVIHLCAHQCHEGFAVDDQFVIISLDNLIKLACLLYIVHRVG